MKKITRLPLALIMFSLFSISYLVTLVSANPDTVCIPESAKDQARKIGFKCMTPETIEIITTRAAKNCRENIIKGHGKVRAGKNDKRASKNLNPFTMQQEIMEKTSFCVEKNRYYNARIE